MLVLSASLALTLALVSCLAATYQQPASPSLSASTSTSISTSTSTSTQQQPSPNGTTANSANPYWRRPGCYRVGHTRTISIPGCVKFNLSTNACRGYCMSYSLPASEDLGASAEFGLVGDEINAPIEQEALLKKQPDLVGPSESAFRDNNQLEAHKRTLNAGSDSNTLTLPKVKTTMGNNWSRISSINRNQFNKPLTESNQALLATSGVSQQTERRDVVSVSQCCNMMETEEVVVNLRCANETRRLVFKSAKTCECFFCKQV